MGISSTLTGNGAGTLPPASPGDRPRILSTEPLGASGRAVLEQGGAEVVDVSSRERAHWISELADCSALLVGGDTRVDRELLAAAPSLRVIGRMGTDVARIDVEAASERGVLVVHSPLGDVASAVEHTFALLFALSRHLAPAYLSLREGRWERRRFLGNELWGKRLGVVGLGRVGQRMVDCARAFGMEVAASDPFIDPAVAQRLEIPLMELDDLLRRSQVVTIHIPATSHTRSLMDERRLRLLAPEALLIHCAAPGVVDEDALLSALDAGRIAGAGIDAFVQEPPADLRLVSHPRVVATPRLGAYTREAHERASEEVAEQVLAALAGALPVSAVNLPFRWSRDGDQVFLRLGEQLGRLASALAEGVFRRLTVTLQDVPDELHRAISLAVARGCLAPVVGDGVSLVNVESRMEQRGVEMVVRRRSGAGDYSRLVEVRLDGGEEEGEGFSLAGSLFDDGEPRVVRFGRISLEFRPYGRLLVVRTEDTLGVLGKVGSLLGDEGVNIADVHLARRDGEADAWTVLRLDDMPRPQVMARLEELPELRRALVVGLGPDPS